MWSNSTNRECKNPSLGDWNFLLGKKNYLFPKGTVLELCFPSYLYSQKSDHIFQN